MTTRLILAAIAAILAAPLVAGAEEMPMGTMHKGMAMHASDTPSDAAYKASMARMMKGMAVKPTGDADKDFVAMMLPHHQGAIDMAKVELKYGKDPMLLKLARDIVAAQEKEIADMKAWQARNGT